MNFKNLLKIFAAGVAGTAANTFLPVVAQLPSKYAPIATAGIMAALYATNPPKKEDAQTNLQQSVAALAAQVQQLQQSFIASLTPQK